MLWPFAAKAGRSTDPVCAGITTAVVCTGSEIIVLTIGPDGQPVELPETTSTDCVLHEESSDIAAHTPLWTALARSYSVAFVPVTHPAPNGQRALVRPFSHGPPEQVKFINTQF